MSTYTPTAESSTDSQAIRGPFTEYDRHGEETGISYHRCVSCGREAIERDEILHTDSCVDSSEDCGEDAGFSTTAESCEIDSARNPLIGIRRSVVPKLTSETEDIYRDTKLTKMTVKKQSETEQEKPNFKRLETSNLVVMNTVVKTHGLSNESTEVLEEMAREFENRLEAKAKALRDNNEST